MGSGLKMYLHILLLKLQSKISLEGNSRFWLFYLLFLSFFFNPGPLFYLQTNLRPRECRGQGPTLGLTSALMSKSSLAVEEVTDLLAWELRSSQSHGQRSQAGHHPWGRKRVRHDLATNQQLSQVQWEMPFLQLVTPPPRSAPSVGSHMAPILCQEGSD